MPRRRPNIRKLVRKGDLDRLRSALRFRDDLVDRYGQIYDIGAATRAEAVRGLVELDDPEVFEVLLDAVEDPSPDVRQQLVESLASLDDPRTLEVLVDAVLHWNERPLRPARDAAETALRDASGPGATLLATAYLADDGSADVVGPLLKDLLAASAPDVQQAVAESALTSLAEGGDDAEERACAVLLALGPAAIPFLVSAASDGRAGVQVLLLLGHLHDSRALQPLVAALRSPDPGRRAAAASALGEIRDSRAMEPLLALSADPDYAVRVAALEAVPKLGPPPRASNYPAPLMFSSRPGLRNQPSWFSAVLRAASPGTRRPPGGA